MIIYLHGFGTIGYGSNKHNQLKKHFEDEIVVAPNYEPHNPTKSLSYLKTYLTHTSENINKNGNILVGSSIGGYYAYLLSDLFQFKFVLINPVLDLATQLEKNLGLHTNFVTGERFEVTSEMVQEAKALKTIPYHPHSTEGLVLLDLGDELIDAKQSEFRFIKAGVNVISYSGGTHAFKHMNQSMKYIKALMIE